MENNKLKALVIERVLDKWGMVNMTELTEDGTWHCGLNLITSIEDVVEKADKEKVPIWTRSYLEYLRNNSNICHQEFININHLQKNIKEK